jgi:hypothetical protein
MALGAGSATLFFGCADADAAERARELELFSFFFFRFSQTGLVKTGVHGCREVDRAKDRWVKPVGIWEHPCNSRLQPQDPNVKNDRPRLTTLFSRCFCLGGIGILDVREGFCKHKVLVGMQLERKMTLEQATSSRTNNQRLLHR